MVLLPFKPILWKFETPFFSQIWTSLFWFHWWGLLQFRLNIVQLVFYQHSLLLLLNHSHFIHTKKFYSAKLLHFYNWTCEIWFNPSKSDLCTNSSQCNEFIALSATTKNASLSLSLTPSSQKNATWCWHRNAAVRAERQTDRVITVELKVTDILPQKREREGERETCPKVGTKSFLASRQAQVGRSGLVAFYFARVRGETIFFLLRSCSPGKGTYCQARVLPG